MRRINFFSLIALFIFVMNSGDVVGAEVCKNEMQTIKIFNRSSYEVFVYFNKEDAKNNQNYKFSVYARSDLQVEVSQSDFSKIYLKRRDHDGYSRLRALSIIISDGPTAGSNPFYIGY